MLRDYMPCLAMVLLQVGNAVMNITSKLAMESGMKPLVLVAYSQIFSLTAIALFGFYMERPKITMPILFQLFLCSTCVTVNQVFYILGLEHLTATTSCALNDLLPAVTFVLEVFWRLENVGIRTAAGQAKVIGTIVCVGGSTLLSFYHGHIIDVTTPGIHWKYAQKMNESSSNNGTNFLGPFLIMVSCVSWAVGFIIQEQPAKERLAEVPQEPLAEVLQAQLVEKLQEKREEDPAPYTTTAVMWFMVSIKCTAIAFISEHRISAWSLSPSIRLIASLYAGIVCNALSFCLVRWTIKQKGPLYVSMFSPLSSVIVAILSFALLHEKLFIGTLAGSVLIVVGLYAVLWGQSKSKHKMEANQDGQTDDLESHVEKINGHPTKIEEKLDPVRS